VLKLIKFIYLLSLQTKTKQKVLFDSPEKLSDAILIASNFEQFYLSNNSNNNNKSVLYGSKNNFNKTQQKKLFTDRS